MKKYKCIANCPELDYKEEIHCIFTEFELDKKHGYDEEVCPYGNYTELILINKGFEE